MVTKEDILIALNSVKDPELEVGILARQLVGGLDILEDGRLIKVWLDFQRKMPGCPGCAPIAWFVLRRIVKDVKEAVGKLPGVETVEVIVH